MREIGSKGWREWMGVWNEGAWSEGCVWSEGCGVKGCMERRREV